MIKLAIDLPITAIAPPSATSSAQTRSHLPRSIGLIEFSQSFSQNRHRSKFCSSSSYFGRSQTYCNLSMSCFGRNQIYFNFFQSRFDHSVSKFRSYDRYFDESETYFDSSSS